jgi:hypothetical protein
MPPKVVPREIIESDLAEYLESQDDFSLELFVLRTADKAGFKTSHGGTYEDPITQKSRQFDIRASLSKGIHELSLAIECKALRRSFPLLVSRVPRVKSDACHSLVYSWQPGQVAPGIGIDWAPSRTINVDAVDSLYKSSEPVGKALTQVGRSRDGDLVSSDGESYEKWSQALSSSAELISKAWLGYMRSPKRDFYSMVMPILVVSDSTLWVADYGSSGDLLHPPRQEQHVQMFVGRTYKGPQGLAYTISHLHILSRSALGGFLEQVATDTHTWDQLFPPFVAKPTFEA